MKHKIEFYSLEKDISNRPIKKKIFEKLWYKTTSILQFIFLDREYAIPDKEFNKNWDIECLEKVLKKECVLSNKNNAIDSNFIFFKKEIIKDIKFPSYLKMLGESEDISIKLYCKGIDMISGLEGLVTMDNNDSYDYLPFSKTHNYNEVERLYKNGFNSYCSIQEEHSRYQEYSKMFNLKKVYDQINDVEYSDFDMPYLNPERFKYGKEKLTI